MIRKTLPGTQSESMVYNLDGTLHQLTDYNDHRTTYGYDSAGRQNLVSHADGSSLSTLYNPDGTVQQSVRTPAAGNAVTATYVYDPNRGFLTSRTTQVGSISNTVSYGYDDTGNKLYVQTPAGKTQYTYDADNRLASVKSPDGATTTYGYDHVGNRSWIQRPNGVLASYTYNMLNRLTNITNYTVSAGAGGVISSYTYALDPAGRRTGVAESGSASQNASTAYQYDEDDRLTSEAGPAGDIAYAYDGVGNRTSKVVTGGAGAGTTSYQYDTGGDDRLAGESGPGGSFGYGYDFDGNQTSETYPNGTVQTNNFDFENHLTGVTDTAGGATTTVAAYSYDADGNRLTETTPAGTTNFLVDTQLSYPSVVEERNVSGSLFASYDYGDDLVRMDRWSGSSATPSYYLDDGLGSTRALTSLTGNVTDSYNFDAYGNETSGTTNTPNEYLYDGQQFDAGIGDYFLRARYYAQSDGRFLSQDPYEGDGNDPVTLHRYLYASDSPTLWSDPGGRDDSIAEVTVSSSIVVELAAVEAGAEVTAGAVADETIAEAVGPILDGSLENFEEYETQSIVAQYGPMDPGPLSIETEEGEQGLAATFRSGTYSEFTNNEPVTFYRVYNAENPMSKFGTFWSRAVPRGGLQTRMDQAVLTNWSPLDRIVAIECPPGTTFYEGFTAGQEGAAEAWLGGGDQVVFPQSFSTSGLEIGDYTWEDFQSYIANLATDDGL